MTAAANTVQITVQKYNDVCTVENLFAVWVGARTQNCIVTLSLFHQ